ncbi:MAG: hypothetical protein R3210_07195 [Roseovarius sp.]|nr:hypothetical protein [Roseovarius sp.]
MSFSRLWDLTYLTHASGRTRVVPSFTARNATDPELKFRFSCLSDGPTLIETQVSEFSS